LEENHSNLVNIVEYWKRTIRTGLTWLTIGREPFELGKHGWVFRGNHSNWVNMVEYWKRTIRTGL